MWFFFPWRTPPFAAFAMQALESMRHSSLRPGLPGNLDEWGDGTVLGKNGTMSTVCIYICIYIWVNYNDLNLGE
jgi:hypothetical protein